MKLQRSSVNIRLYSEARRRVKTIIKQAKRRHEENIATESKNDVKMFFLYINTKKHIGSRIGPLKDSAGNLVTNDQSMASMLNNYFSSVFNVPAEDDLITNNDSDNNNNDTDNVPLTKLEHTLPDFDINTEDVLKASNGLKTNKSPGPDNIYLKILKEAKNEIVDALTSLFNLSIRRGIVPADWKAANTIPFFLKKRGEKHFRELQTYYLDVCSVQNA